MSEETANKQLEAYGLGLVLIISANLFALVGIIGSIFTVLISILLFPTLAYYGKAFLNLTDKKVLRVAKFVVTTDVIISLILITYFVPELLTVINIPVFLISGLLFAWVLTKISLSLLDFKYGDTKEAQKELIEEKKEETEQKKDSLTNFESIEW